MAMRANDLPAAMQADMQVQGLFGLNSLGWVLTKSGLLDAIEKGRPADSDAPKAPSYLERSKEVEALLAKFPKVNAGPLGQEFAQLKRVLYEALEDTRTGKIGLGETGCRNPVRDSKGEWLSAMNPLNKGGSCGYYLKEKQLYENFLKMNRIQSQVLDEAGKAGDTGVQLAPEVVEALKNAQMPDGQKPPGKTNWWLWGGVGSGVLLLGGLLWWKASKIGKQAPVQGLGRMSGGRKFRSRKNSR